MGKSKKRILNRKLKQDFTVLKKENAIKHVVNDIKTKNVTKKTIKYIDLFGIMPEDLTEEGILYEELSIIKKFLI